MRDLFSSTPKPDPTQTNLVKTWVREIFMVPDDVTVMITELQCTEPGCPPMETVIAIMRTGQAPEQYKLHQAVVDVTHSDIAALNP